MKQEMHTWLATLLVVLTIKIFFSKYQFHKVDNNHDKSVSFIVNWVAPIITFIIWLYFII